MFRKTRNDVLVHTQDVQEMDTVVIAYNIIGNIKNCQVVSFQKMLRRPMTGLLRIS
jgi:hypothetical protein